MIWISEPTYEMQHAFLNLWLLLEKIEAVYCIKMYQLVLSLVI